MEKEIKTGNYEWCLLLLSLPHLKLSIQPSTLILSEKLDNLIFVEVHVSECHQKQHRMQKNKCCL